MINDALCLIFERNGIAKVKVLIEITISPYPRTLPLVQTPSSLSKASFKWALSL